MEISKFPPVPTQMDQHQSFTSDGKPVEVIQPNRQVSLGANFSGLIGSQVTVPVTTNNQVITETSPKRKKKKKDSKEIVVSPGGEVVDGEDPVNSKEIVEGTIYADTYVDTNNMTYGVIQQADQLLSECKQDMDYIRSQRSMKGKYHYINANVTAMTQLLSTKLAAIKEINSTIKNANDSEYRRFKDMRALDNTDDNKAVMDAYTAFISAPVGAPQFNLPTTADITGGMNGVVPAALPANVQQSVDAGMAQYLSSLSPEENMMLNETNRDIEEVIIYDQSTGAKKFAWVNTRTNEQVPNMPVSSNLTIDDYVLDTRIGLAKNKNVNDVKKIVIQNGGAFNGF